MIKISFVLISILFILSGCDSKVDQNSQNSGSKSYFSENTPKGQASVVDNVSEKNILQVAAESSDHTTLVAAVKAAEIEHILVNAGPLTVFAPNNSAFDALPEGTVKNLLKPENKSALAEILSRHAAPGTFDLKQLKKEAKKGRKIYTATGDYFDVVIDGEDIFVAGAKILATVSTSNGIINVVDKVILLED